METNILVEIIFKYERGNDWQGLTSGVRSLSFAKTSLYNKYGQSNLVAEAKYWEEQGLIQVKWLSYHFDIERIFYSLSDISRIYEITGRITKKIRIENAIEYLKVLAKQVRQSWIFEYYESLIEQLEKGNWPEELDRCGDGKRYESGHLMVGDKGYVNHLFLCLNGIDGLEHPVYKKIFSKYFLGDSKLFEKKLEGRVLTIARNRCANIDDSMNNTQALAELYIEEYAQELCVKGELIVVQDGVKIDLSIFRYGTVLNSEMLKHVKVADGQRISKLITVENKANYMSLPYEEGTLIIYSHGYFTPKERKFLQELERTLQDDEVQYFHTGDLDYGGICIFRYIRKQIFPKLQPLKMDVRQFEKYKEMAVAIEDSTWEKLKQLREPKMQQLIDYILKERKVIEQESFLMM